MRSSQARFFPPEACPETVERNVAADPDRLFESGGIDWRKPTRRMS